MQDRKQYDRVIGIDPGYGRCGFGIIEKRKRDWTCVTHGVFVTGNDKFHEDRLHELGKDFEAMVKRYKPELLVIEEIYFAQSTTTALKVAEVRGIIMMLARKLGIDVVQVKPNEVKLAVTGYGRAEKQQMQEMVKTIFGLKEVPKPDDAADALAVAWTGANKSRF